MRKISVIIPTFEHADSISICIKSVLGQSRVVDEIIIVDDGSTDVTQEILKTFFDKIDIIYQNNNGAPSARNTGFRKSTGDMVLFCDADVEMKPTMIEELEKYLEQNSEIAYAYCRFKWMNRSFACGEFDVSRIRKENYIHTSSALIRREDFLQWDEELKKFQDWDLWLSMLEKGSFGGFVDRELYTVHQIKNRQNISTWLPSILYKIPWRFFGFMPEQVKKYNTAKSVIISKHNL